MPILFDNESEKRRDFLDDWYKVRKLIKDQFGKRPDLNAILYLIGMNELGFVKEEFEKEEKEDLMHIAICKLFEKDGYFYFLQRDEQGWPHYAATKNMPKVKLREQEQLLKEKVIEYFKEQDLI